MNAVYVQRCANGYVLGDGPTINERSHVFMDGQETEMLAHVRAETAPKPLTSHGIRVALEGARADIGDVNVDGPLGPAMEV